MRVRRSTTVAVAAWLLIGSWVAAGCSGNRSGPPTCDRTEVIAAAVEVADALPLLLPRCVPAELDRWFLTSQSDVQTQVVFTDRPDAKAKYLPGVWLSVWTGEASAGKPSWSDATPMTIRGRDGYSHSSSTTSEPGFLLTWEERPGVWVLVAAGEPYDLALLTEFAESLTSVDPAAFSDHVIVP